MSINSFESLKTPRIEEMINRGYKLIAFRIGKLIFVRITLTYKEGLLAQATGDSLYIAFKRLDSYLGNPFSTFNLNTGFTSKLDSLVLDNGATIMIELTGNDIKCQLASYDMHLLAIVHSSSIGNSLFSLESAAIKNGL